MWIQGQVVLDRYRLVEALGAGAGGETWRAEGPAGPVAVKLIRGEDPRAFADLAREAALLRGLRHPHVVSYREFADRPDEGCAILVTDLVEGGDLERWRLLHGRPPHALIRRLGLQVLAALDALEAAGVLHRDLKPANVLVDGGGWAPDRRVGRGAGPPAEGGGEPHLRVADFGISRRVRHGVARTVDRSLTPAFAAPEQHTGATLTRAADLYALGGILEFLATGELPRGAPTGDEPLDALLVALRHPDPGQRPGLAEVRRVLEGGAAADRGERGAATFGDGALGAARGATGGGRGATFVPEPGPAELHAGDLETVPPDALAPAEASPRGTSRRARLGPLLVGAALLCAVFLGLGVWIGGRGPTGSEPAALGDGTVQAVDPPPPLQPEGKLADSQPAEAPPAAGPPAVAPAGTATPTPEAAPAAAAAPALAPPPTRAAPSSSTPPPGAPAPVVAAAPATLVVHSSPWSWVYVDGRKLGSTGDVGAQFEVSAGRHAVRFENDDGLTWERTLLVEGEKRVCVNLRLGTEIGC